MLDPGMVSIAATKEDCYRNYLSSGVAPSSSSQCSEPPLGFRPAGQVRFASLCHEPGFARNRIASGAKGAGHRFERKAHKHLDSRFPNEYVRSPWFAFSGQGGYRYCQADGLIVSFRKSLITIVECKLRHCDGAYWQLEHLYKPVVAATFGPSWRIALLEVCQWYDGADGFPAPTKLQAWPERCEPGIISIFILG